MPAKSTTPATIETRLDEIVLHLQRLDKRDKLRTIGGFFRFLISLIPLVVLLGGGWYFLNHASEVLKMMMDQAASSAAHVTKASSTGFFDQFLK